MLRRLNLVRVILLLTLVLLTTTVPAQDEIILQLSISDRLMDSSSILRSAMREFEEQNPGVYVQLVRNGNRVIFPPESAEDIDRYLGEIRWFATQGDVVLVDSSWLLPEATQAGYFLDLAPLITLDASLNQDDFFPAAWQSFQWDNGVWAIPASYEPLLLLYDPEAFDTAGLPYPDGNWTLADLENVARILTENTGSPALTVWFAGDLAILLRSLLDSKPYDDTILPTIPRFDDPQLQTLVQTLGRMKTEGLLEVKGLLENDPGVKAPITIASLGQGMFRQNSGSALAPLPGNRTSLQVEGFTVSRGTLYPEMAYELIKFLSEQPGLFNMIGPMPARSSVPQTFTMSDAMGDLVDSLLANAVPTAELRFMHYLAPLIDTPVSADLTTTLVDLQAQVTVQLIDNFDQREDLTININPPEPLSDVPPDQQLYFAVVSNISPWPTRGQWQRLAQEFADQDPEIGQVNIETENDVLTRLSENFDCFYVPRNMVSPLGLGLLRNLDPLLANDPAFDPDDFVGDVLSQASLNDQIWAFPLTIEPNVMWYSEPFFEEAGVPFPENGWTISDFTGALAALHSGDRPRLLTSYHFFNDNSYLLMLIAAYGGLPFDYRVDPPILNFTDPTTVDAIRQVLDLAKTGTMNYLALSDPMASPAAASGTSALILTDLDDGNSRGGKIVTMGSTQGRPFHLLNYPRGSHYTPVSHNVGAAYISANTTHIESCYRFISFISQHPDLFTAMPVRLSQINSPEVAASRPAETIAFYNALAERMQDPNLVEFPEDFYLHLWLNRAFDNYVLEDADLVAELEEAETRTLEFLACVDAQEPAEDGRAYGIQQYECMMSVDPNISPFPSG